MRCTRPADGAWELGRAGRYREAVLSAQKILARRVCAAPPSTRVDAHLAIAFCAMRQGHLDEAKSHLEDASRAASQDPSKMSLALHVDVWRAELAYFQGHYSSARRIVDRVLGLLAETNDQKYTAFALRIRIALLLARGDYDGIAATADAALKAAHASCDP